MEHQALHRPRADPQPQTLQARAGPGHTRLASMSQQMNASAPVQRLAAMAPTRGGLPAGLRAGIEALSGVSMAGVRVHRNSAKPAQLQAQAYAQGKDIHLAPGREHHLAHEAWHVVQQAQGRVKPTMQLKGDVPVNDDAGLEHEADVMGARAMSEPVQRRVAQRATMQRKAVPVQFARGPKSGRRRPGFASNVGRMRRHAKKVLSGAQFDMAHRMSYSDIDHHVFNPKTSKTKMTRLIRDLTVPARRFGPVPKGDTAYYKTALSLRHKPEKLVRLLNSSPYNLRPGNPSKNRGIGARGDLHYEPPAKPKLKRTLTPQSKQMEKWIRENRGESSDMMSKSQFTAFEKGIDNK